MPAIAQTCAARCGSGGFRRFRTGLAHGCIHGGDPRRRGAPSLAGERPAPSRSMTPCSAPEPVLVRTSFGFISTGRCASRSAIEGGEKTGYVLTGGADEFEVSVGSQIPSEPEIE